ncbi:NAD(P)-binding protein [Athelia psychrophila]|uniref:D-xylose 1-dehydrogenase (NADP(+), D-xylono-1,5-lactone-forming) n=1 Tax=Athelia psychrophila TaxID=1759441 RepID=A0A166JQ11_9AGAM|nr:NAD(P)-binding protein [Fibularhizoctonia sp. CBS 109695]
MFSLISLVQHIRTLNNPPVLPVQASPLRFGILGAANIAPNSLILPARNHPEMVIEKVYSGAHGYQNLLDDPMVDAVYNPLPNGLHFEWTMKVLAAGKHVLLEKPSADTVDETRQMFELAERKGLVLLEAYHYRFYPAIARIKDILNSGELGQIKSMRGSLGLPQGFVGPGDIRLEYALGGGAMMDCGCYPLSALRYSTSANPTAIFSETVRTISSASDTGHLIDLATTAILSFPNDVTGTIHCDLAIPSWGPFGLIPSMPDMKLKVDCEGGSVELFNFPLSSYYHSITVTVKDGKGGLRKRVEKAYTFEDGRNEEEWWSTYRHQLEAFVDKVKGRTPKMWVSKEDSVDNMIWIEKVYEKSGLGSRPKSKYAPSE